MIGAVTSMFFVNLNIYVKFDMSRASKLTRLSDLELNFTYVHLHFQKIFKGYIP